MNVLRHYGLTLLVLLLAGLIALSEWVTTPRAKPGPVEITYWEKWTGFEGDAMRAVVDAFNQSQDRIYVNLFTISGIQNKTLLAVAGGNPPDVAGLYSPNVAQYADALAITPLDAYCAKAGIRADQYIPTYWDIGNYRGHTYALPTAPASTALHYNRTLLREAGLDPDKPPQTLEEMDAMAEKITQRNPDNRFKVLGFTPAEPGWWNFSWGCVFGGKLWEGGEKLTANSKENIRAFEWIRNYAQKYGVNEMQTFRNGFGNFSSPQNAFLSSKVAMEIQGVWMYNFVEKYAPKLEWSAAPFPHPADRPDLANSTYIEADVLVIPRGAKHPDEAFEFIRFVQSQKGMELLCMGQRKHSPLVKVSDAFWKKHPNPYIRLFSEIAKSKNAYAAPKIGVWPEYQAEMNSVFEEVALLKATPEAALNKAQARMQPKYDAYLKIMRLRDKQFGKQETAP